VPARLPEHALRRSRGVACLSIRVGPCYAGFPYPMKMAVEFPRGFMRIVASSVMPLRAPIPRDIKVAGPDADPCLSRSLLDRDVVENLVQAHKRKRPESRGAPKIQPAVPQAATLVGLTSRSLLELAIGIDRGFMTSGTSRTSSTCRSPFSRLAPLTLT
jgi:hypothetical protein